MNRKDKIDSGVFMAFILISFGIILLPLFKYDDVKTIMIIIFGSYFIGNTIRFFFSRNKYDYDAVMRMLGSLLMVALCLFVNLEIKKNIAIMLMIWVTICAFIRIKKMDYFNDKKDNKWKIEAITLGLFIVTGIVSSISFIYTNNVANLGYFVLVSNILNLIIPMD